MATLWKVKSFCCSSKALLPFYPALSRAFSTSQTNQSGSGSSEGWFSKFLHVRKIDPGKDSHSRLLSDAEYVYELHIHDVKPECMEKYMKNYENWVEVLKGKANDSELVGSWKVEVGDQDQVVHIWRYTGGWPSATRCMNLVRTDIDLVNLSRDQAPLIRSRQNQFMLTFSFWGHPKPREGKNMYEMRSYILKPGTMIEWGNNWARGITYRRSSAVAGFFSQIGQLYMVHHIWAYKDLQARKDIREDAWRKPGWDECVAYTVPLIREMRSRWLLPNTFSPLQ